MDDKSENKIIYDLLTSSNKIFNDKVLQVIFPGTNLEFVNNARNTLINVTFDFKSLNLSDTNFVNLNDRQVLLYSLGENKWSNASRLLNSMNDFFENTPIIRNCSLRSNDGIGFTNSLLSINDFVDLFTDKNDLGNVNKLLMLKNNSWCFDHLKLEHLSDVSFNAISADDFLNYRDNSWRNSKLLLFGSNVNEKSILMFDNSKWDYKLPTIDMAINYSDSNNYPTNNDFFSANSLQKWQSVKRTLGDFVHFHNPLGNNNIIVNEQESLNNTEIKFNRIFSNLKPTLNPSECLLYDENNNWTNILSYKCLIGRFLNNQNISASDNSTSLKFTSETKHIVKKIENVNQQMFFQNQKVFHDGNYYLINKNNVTFSYNNSDVLNLYNKLNDYLLANLDAYELNTDNYIAITNKDNIFKSTNGPIYCNNELFFSPNHNLLCSITSPIYDEFTIAIVANFNSNSSSPPDSFYFMFNSTNDALSTITLKKKANKKNTLELLIETETFTIPIIDDKIILFVKCMGSLLSIYVNNRLSLKKNIISENKNIAIGESLCINHNNDWVLCEYILYNKYLKDALTKKLTNHLKLKHSINFHTMDVIFNSPLYSKYNFDVSEGTLSSLDNKLSDSSFNLIANNGPLLLKDQFGNRLNFENNQYLYSGDNFKIENPSTIILECSINGNDDNNSGTLLSLSNVMDELSIVYNNGSLIFSENSEPTCIINLTKKNYFWLVIVLESNDDNFYNNNVHRSKIYVNNNLIFMGKLTGASVFDKMIVNNNKNMNGNGLQFSLNNFFLSNKNYDYEELRYMMIENMTQMIGTLQPMLVSNGTVNNFIGFEKL